MLQHTASTRITYLHMRTTYIHLVRSRPCPFPCGHSVQAAVRRQQGSPPAREYSTRGALVPTPARRQHSPPPQTPRTHRHACVHAKHFDLAARYPAGALQLRSRPGAPRSGLLPRCTSSAQRHHLAPPPPTQPNPSRTASTNKQQENSFPAQQQHNDPRQLCRASAALEPDWLASAFGVSPGSLCTIHLGLPKSIRPRNAQRQAGATVPPNQLAYCPCVRWMPAAASALCAVLRAADLGPCRPLPGPQLDRSRRLCSCWRCQLACAFCRASRTYMCVVGVWPAAAIYPLPPCIGAMMCSQRQNRCGHRTATATPAAPDSASSVGRPRRAAPGAKTKRALCGVCRGCCEPAGAASLPAWHPETLPPPA